MTRVLTYLVDALYLSYIFILVDITIFFTIARIIIIASQVYELDELDELYESDDDIYVDELDQSYRE